jgi:hypothetical protein
VPDPGGGERPRPEGDQRRPEREEAERWALQRMLQERSLADVVYEAMSRGDQLGVELPGGRSFVGRVTHGAGDLARIETAHLLVDVNLALVQALWVVRRPRARGVERGPGVLSFRARLKELERSGAAERLRLLQQLKRLGSPRVAKLPVPDRTPAEVELGLAGRAEPLRGQIEAVAEDHVYFVDRARGEWFLPLARVAYVVERR